MSQMTAPVDAVTRADRAILRVAALSAAVVVLVTIGVAVVTGEPAELIRTGFAAAVGLLA